MTEVKYIDPTYMIRAIKPNANDSASHGPWGLLWVSEVAMSGDRWVWIESEWLRNFWATQMEIGPAWPSQNKEKLSDASEEMSGTNSAPPFWKHGERVACKKRGRWVYERANFSILQVLSMKCIEMLFPDVFSSRAWWNIPCLASSLPIAASWQRSQVFTAPCWATTRYMLPWRDIQPSQ